MVLNKFLYSFCLIVMLCPSVYAADQATIIPEVNLKPDTEVKTKIKAVDAKIQSTHFTEQEIVESPVNQLTALFRQEQSIVRLTNSSQDNNQTALSIRGFGDNAVANSLILIDGFPLTNPSLLVPNFNSIALSDIERIDILQGSEGTLWGDQAVGGVVNIVTKHPEKFFATLDLTLGNYNKKFLSGIVGQKYTNGIFVKAFAFGNQSNQYRDSNQQSTKNIAATLGIDYATGSLQINLQAYEDTTQLPGGLTDAQFHEDPTQATKSNFTSHLTTRDYQLLSQQALNENWLLETRIAYHNTRGDGFIFFDYARSDTSVRFSPRLIGTINRIKVTTGLDEQIGSYDLTNPRTEIHAQSNQQDVYLQGVMALTDKLDLTLGSRYARQHNKVSTNIRVNAWDHAWVSEQGLSYRLADNWTMFLRRDGNFSLPKTNEEAWIPVNTNTLKVQTGTSYEAGTTWQSMVQKIQLNIYYLTLINEIAFNPTQTTEQPFGSFYNFPKTLRRGVTLTDNYYITQDLELTGQFNYVDARFAGGPFAGNLIPAVPAINSNLNLNYQFKPNWWFKYGILFTGNRYASEDNENIGKRLPGYWLHHLAFQYFNYGYYLSFEIMNLFNQRYSTYTYFDNTEKTNLYFPGNGREYLLTFKVDI